MPNQTSRWYVRVTENERTGGFTAWATETQPPRHVTGRDMLTYPGEVHFEFGDTAHEAIRALERALPA